MARKALLPSQSSQGWDPLGLCHRAGSESGGLCILPAPWTSHRVEGALKRSRGSWGWWRSVLGRRRASRPVLSTSRCLEFSSLPTHSVSMCWGLGAANWFPGPHVLGNARFVKKQQKQVVLTETAGAHPHMRPPPGHTADLHGPLQADTAIGLSAGQQGSRPRLRIFSLPLPLPLPAPPPLALPEAGEGSGREGGWGLQQLGAWAAECSCAPAASSH